MYVLCTIQLHYSMVCILFKINLYNCIYCCVLNSADITLAHLLASGLDLCTWYQRDGPHSGNDTLELLCSERSTLCSQNATHYR